VSKGKRSSERGFSFFGQSLRVLRVKTHLPLHKGDLTPHPSACADTFSFSGDATPFVLRTFPPTGEFPAGEGYTHGKDNPSVIFLQKMTAPFTQGRLRGRLRGSRKSRNSVSGGVWGNAPQKKGLRKATERLRLL